MLQVKNLRLSEVKILTPRRFEDDRGYFSESYNAKRFADVGVDVDFVQDNHSRSTDIGTVRGLHYQAPPHAQAKLVRVVRGRIFDVAVDARAGSPTFGQWVAAELSEANGEQIFVPTGFLHGFMTLEPDTHVVYKVDNYYDQASDGAIRFDDPDLGIDWPLPASQAVLSEKDRAAKLWGDFESPFSLA